MDMRLIYQRTTFSLVGDAPHDDFLVLYDGQPTGLGYFRDPAPGGPSNSFSVRVDGGPVQHVAIHRSSDDLDRYMLVHAESGMTFHYFFLTEAHVRQHVEGLLAIGIDWTQPVEVLQQHPIWPDIGRRNKEIVNRILGVAW